MGHGPGGIRTPKSAKRPGVSDFESESGLVMAAKVVSAPDLDLVTCLEASGPGAVLRST